jgi:hypothetical protein
LIIRMRIKHETCCWKSWGLVGQSWGLWLRLRAPHWQDLYCSRQIGETLRRYLVRTLMYLRGLPYPLQHSANARGLNLQGTRVVWIKIETVISYLCKYERSPYERSPTKHRKYNTYWVKAVRVHQTHLQSSFFMQSKRPLGAFGKWLYRVTKIDYLYFQPIREVCYTRITFAFIIYICGQCDTSTAKLYSCVIQFYHICVESIVNVASIYTKSKCVFLMHHISSKCDNAVSQSADWLKI